MARTTGPLLSLGGSGAIAKTQVYSTWRGIPYARQYVKPANPNTEAQQVTRSLFSFLNTLWKLAPVNVQAPWTANAKGKQFTDRNKFIGDNVKGMRGDANIADLIMSPGANGGLIAADLVATPAAGEVDAVLTAPDLPVGWAITSAVFALVGDSDPLTENPASVVVVTDAVAPYEANFASLSAGDYLVSAWFVFTKPNGSLAYGPSRSSMETVT